MVFAKRITWLVLILSTSFSCFSQDLERIGKGGVKLSGGISANQVFYYSDGISARRDPYNYFLSGNATLSLYGITMPFTFSFSNQKFSYGQPFNIVGLSPRYKWVTAHIGWRSMVFSPYTLNGHRFFGAGVEIEPIKGWKTSAMYGQFLRAVNYDSTTHNRPAYERRGFGLKTQYTWGKGSIGASMFSASDLANSTNMPLDVAGITPQQNVVLGLSFSKKIENLILSFEGARSAITIDTRSDLDNEKKQGLDAVFFIPKKTSTSYYNAFKANATYQFKWFGLGLGYERIDPNYKTLGAYYFNQDLENITGNFNATLFKNKVTISGNAGTQHDNLDRSKIATMKRFVGAGNIGFVPSQKWNFSFSYSNFQSFANIQPQIRNITRLTPYDNMDTLNFVQISQSMQASVMHVIRADQEISSTVMVSGSYQQSTEKRGENGATAGPAFYNANANYGLNFIKTKLGINLGANTNISGPSSNQTIFIGPTASANKGFYEGKLRCGLSVNWNKVLLNGQSNSSIWNIGQNNSLTLAKKHQLNLNTTYVHMQQPSLGQVGTLARAMNEVTVTLGYGYSF